MKTAKQEKYLATFYSPDYYYAGFFLPNRILSFMRVAPFSLDLPSGAKRTRIAQVSKSSGIKG